MMKIEINKTRPAYLRESWPGEYDDFSYFDHAAVVPQILSMITTQKENGKPNAAFHSGCVFTGDPTGYYVILPGLTAIRHTGGNILREKEFCVNFLPGKYYEACLKTIEENDDNTDEIAAGGFTAEACKTIGTYRIMEAVLSFECTLSQAIDITGQGKAITVIGKVELAAIEEQLYLLEHMCGMDGFMFHIPSPHNPVTGEQTPTAAACLSPFPIPII